MPAALPMLIFLPIFVAIGFLVANQRRAPQLPPTDAQRRAKVVMILAAACFVILLGIAGLMIVRH
jgi:hypothetical protein